MSNLAYRAERVGIRLVNRGSTFWSRFRLWLRGVWGQLLAYAGAAYEWAEARTWFVGGATILFAALALVTVTMLAVGALKCATPDCAEQLLPRELHLFEDDVMVVPFTGAAFHTPWSAYVVGATASRGGVRLVLGREPRLEFFVGRSALTPEQWTLLRRWLEAQQLLVSGDG